MTAFESIKQSLSTDLGRLNELIRGCLQSGNPLMDKVIEGYLKSTGKQIRPIIVLLCAGMFGEIGDKALNVAAAVELLHNASLIHDDVVDDAKLRRSKPTINAIWDNRIAVLVGDFFVSTALQRVIITGDMRVVESIGQLGESLSLGEIDQIYNARTHTLTKEAYFNIINCKTASLFVACAKVGCYVANAPQDAIDKLTQVARLLGQCFQIRDDIFDYYDDPKVGKPTGNDLREGKITLPLLHVLINDNGPEHDEMLALATADTISDADISRLLEYARKNGGIDYAYETMENLRRCANEILDTLPDTNHTQHFREIFDYIIAREV